MYRLFNRYMLFVYLTAIIIITSITQIHASSADLLETPEGFTKISETNVLTLYLNKYDSGIIVIDKRNGYRWMSQVDEKNYFNYSNTSNLLKDAMKSIFGISYTDLTQKNTVVKKINSNAASKINTYAQENGASVEFVFEDIGITLTLDFLLENDTLIIRIPEKGLIEEKGFGIIDITVFPYFGAADRNVTGYLLYPDGSGAITRYKNYDKTPVNREQKIYPIYSDMHTGAGNVMLPIFGIKNNNNAFLAAITVGSENSRVVINPDGFIVDINRANFEFVYRRFYQIPLSNITINGANRAKKLYAERVVNDLLRQDREIRFFFLTDDDADYSGMATAYREYLEENHLINTVIAENDLTPMAIDFFMGISEKGLVFNDYIPMTSYKQARDIISLLSERNVDKLQVKLTGWQKNGYQPYYTFHQPEGKLGGEKALNELAGYANANNIPLFLENTFIYGSGSGQNKISSKKDAVYTPASLPSSFTYPDDNNNKLFIINPFSALRFAKNALDNNYAAGIGLNYIGRYVYDDYNKYNPSNISQTIELWQEIIAESRSHGNLAAVDGGNLYILRDADRLYNIPSSSSEYYITDESVPFYQMIVHGNIPYTSQAGNYSANIRKDVLRWIEYGSIPSFELTYEDASKLRDTNYSRLFSSRYDYWLDAIAEIYNEFQTRIGKIYSSKMISHQMLYEDVYKIAYSNGEIIYLNYSNNTVIVEGRTISSMDFIVVEKDGSIR